MELFAYNNTKNASTGHMLLKLNCGYYPWMSYKKKVDLCSKSKSANELSVELRELIIVCQENLHHAQELQKPAYDNSVKPKNFALSDKIWLESKYIKTKYNQKLEAKFFKLFRVFHPVEKQVYKLELLKSLWCFLCVIAGEGHHKEGVDRQKRNKARCLQQWW